MSDASAPDETEEIAIRLSRKDWDEIVGMIVSYMGEFCVGDEDETGRRIIEAIESQSSVEGSTPGT